MDYFTVISQVNMKQFKSVSDNIISSVTLDLLHGKNINMRLEISLEVSPIRLLILAQVCENFFWPLKLPKTELKTALIRKIRIY